MCMVCVRMSILPPLSICFIFKTSKGNKAFSFLERSEVHFHLILSFLKKDLLIKCELVYTEKACTFSVKHKRNQVRNLLEC